MSKNTKNKPASSNPPPVAASTANQPPLVSNFGGQMEGIQASTN